MIIWTRRHNRKQPRWLHLAAVAAGGKPKAPPATVAAPAPPRAPTPRASADTPLEVLDSLIADVLQRIGEAREQNADPSTLASFGKDYTNLLDRRATLIAATRAADDGLIAKAHIIQLIDTIHSAIPDRIETALLNAKAEAAAALESGDWPTFCERFRTHHISELARASFAVHLPAA